MLNGGGRLQVILLGLQNVLIQDLKCLSGFEFSKFSFSIKKWLSLIDLLVKETTLSTWYLRSIFLSEEWTLSLKTIHPVFLHQKLPSETNTILKQSSSSWKLIN